MARRVRPANLTGDALTTHGREVSRMDRDLGDAPFFPVIFAGR